MDPVAKIADTFADECRSHCLATLSEGHLKTIAAAAMIGNGFTIIEGSNWNDKGWQVALSSGKLNANLVALPVFTSHQTGKRIAPDLRVNTPSGICTIELQSRCRVGTSSQLSSGSIMDDITRVQNGSADAFILVADADLYDAIRGIKKDPRGRKAKHSAYFAHVFPATSDLPATFGWAVQGQQYDGVETHAILQDCTAGLKRVVAVIKQVKAIANQAL